MNDSEIRIQPLNIKSVNDLAHRLGIRRQILESLAENAGAVYAPFESSNSPRPFQRRPFVKKSRNIDNPASLLKEIQRKINQKLLGPIELPDHVCGGRKGRSVIKTAKYHLAQKVLVTIDIRKFFPSINNSDVYHIWSNILGCGRKVSSILTRLTTIERRLPQGAPTSTALANIFLLSFDVHIRKYCGEKGIIYRTWIDDLIFSGKNARKVIPVVAEAVRQGGLKISRPKVKIMPSHGRQVMMGTVVNKQTGATKEYRQATRSGIHKLRTNQVPRRKIESYVRSIRGRIEYINQSNPLQALRLRVELDSLITLNAS